MAPVTHIVINKARRTLALWTTAGLAGTYGVALGKNWAADKSTEGDHATPVGDFYVCAKNPRSRYLSSLCLSYPNVEDADRGLRAGLVTSDEHTQIAHAIRGGRMPPQHTRLGGEIYIHGHGDRRTDSVGGVKDWTRGCIALDDTHMRVIYDAVTIGTPVVIVAA